MLPHPRGRTHESPEEDDLDLDRGPGRFGCILRVFTLNAARDAIVGGPAEPFTSPDGTIYSMEVGPGGTIYFSTYRGIYRLT